MGKGVEDELGALALFLGHVVARMGGAGGRQLKGGQGGRELVKKAARLNGDGVGTGPAEAVETRGDKGAAQAPGAGRPFDGAFVDVSCPGRGVEATAGKAKFEADHGAPHESSLLSAASFFFFLGSSS